ncbi:MAG: signal peptidase II [Patescibacteria group bacterium]|jgi:signal peptidase II
MRRFAPVYIAAALALIDGAAKYLANQWLPEISGSHFSLFEISLYKNFGIIFSLPIASTVSILMSFVIIVGLIVYLTIKKPAHEITNAIICIELGAIGNLVDRILNGYVTDYLVFFHRSAINLSDILIVTGIFCFLWYARKNGQKN